MVVYTHLMVVWWQVQEGVPTWCNDRLCYDRQALPRGFEQCVFECSLTGSFALGTVAEYRVMDMPTIDGDVLQNTTEHDLMAKRYVSDHCAVVATINLT